MFRQTTPSCAPKTRSGGKKSTPQISRLKNQLHVAKKKLAAKINTQSHKEALERSKRTCVEGYRVQPLGKNDSNTSLPTGGKASKLNNTFFQAQQRELDLKNPHKKNGQAKFPLFARENISGQDDNDGAEMDEPLNEREAMSTQQQQAQKVGGIDTRKHVRSMWYMTPVDGISDQPTAQGRVPQEYQPTKFFIPDPLSNPFLSKLAAHPKVRIKTTAFSHLSDEEKDRALKSLDLPHPTTLHKHEPFPHLNYFSSPRLKDRSPFRTLKLSGAETRAFRSPKLAVTAFSINQVPRLRHHTRDVEIVFVGRSNVGKSSLINALTHSDLAKTGRTPGKTQSLNFYALHPEALRGHRASASALSRASQIDTDRIYGFVSKLDPALTLPLTQTQETTINACYKRAGNGPVMMLVDVPGYGHANAPDWIVDKWNVMLGSYLRLRSPLNFPTDDETKWTTKEFKQELFKLRKNRTQPRRRRVDRTSSRKAPTADELDLAGADFDDDDDDDDEASDAWESDFEQDPLKLFETALNTHVDQMQYHLERRVADYQTLMQKFNELEELQRGLEEQEMAIAQGKRTTQNPLYDPVLVQEKRIALLQLHSELREQIDNDPLNSTATNLPGEWDEDGHNKLREGKKRADEENNPQTAALSRYKRLAARSTQTSTDSATIDKGESEKINESEAAGRVVEATTLPEPPKRPLLRIKPRPVSRVAASPRDNGEQQHSTTTPNTSSDGAQNETTTTTTTKPINTTLKTNFDDDLKQIQDEMDGVINAPDDENKPVAPRLTRLMAKRGGVAPKLPSMLKRARRQIQNNNDDSMYSDEYSDDDQDDANVQPLALMKTYRKLQLLETQLNTHSRNNLQPLQSRLPPLEHLGQLHGSPLKNVVVLLDARAGVTKYDLQFLNFLEKFRITHQVVLTKIDKMSTSELEGAAYSVAQSLFPHEYVKMLQKQQPLQLAAFPEGKMPKNSPTFTVKSNEQDKLWEGSLKYSPRKYLSPLLIGVSSEKRINVDVLQRSLLHGIFERI